MRLNCTVFEEFIFQSRGGVIKKSEKEKCRICRKQRLLQLKMRREKQRLLIR